MEPHRLDAPLAAPPPAELDAQLDATVEWWRAWAGHVREDARSPGVLRSALTLRALVYETTGAVVAAPTTSLPETPGGVRNWDYRYSWVRDSTFTMRSLAEIGCEEQPERFARYIMRSAAGHAGDLQVAYGVAGERRIGESELPLAGYRGARPVRAGNDAVEQDQHDELGEIVNLAWRRYLRGHVPDDDEWRFIASVVDAAAEVWRDPDRGFWEVRGEERHFVHSKATCWSALDRGLRLGEALRRRVPAARWRRERDAAREAVLGDGFDEERGTFLQVLGEPQLDSTALLLPVGGIVAWDDARMHTTVDAVREVLDDDGLLRRYEGDDGLPGREGAFLACSFWLVECLARLGRHAEAREAYERAMCAATPLGLFSEELDTRTGEPAGNFPQGLTHLSHIAATIALRQAGG